MAQPIDLEVVKTALEKLVDVLRDSQKGFAELEANLKDPAARRFFLEETQQRANFAAELENELHRLGVKDVHQSGMLSGVMHRTWGELKAKLGGGDHALLATAEQGEDVAKKSYEEILKLDLPGDIRDLLSQQQARVLESHDKVKALRDSTA